MLSRLASMALWLVCVAALAGCEEERRPYVRQERPRLARSLTKTSPVVVEPEGALEEIFNAALRELVAAGFEIRISNATVGILRGDQLKEDAEATAQLLRDQAAMWRSLDMDQRTMFVNSPDPESQALVRGGGVVTRQLTLSVVVSAESVTLTPSVIECVERPPVAKKCSAAVSLLTDAEARAVARLARAVSRPRVAATLERNVPAGADGGSPSGTIDRAWDGPSSP